ncbi:GNAT family N-acetyltransferase [Profundibacterium mesophilum]|uniref:Acetyltransferase n=1 Tax=Profundibacterium mesophilum KAUST100406-0324 TaxID=1037889 RepID=A0A921TCU2_9RHOB|nr:GNAT family N-acetyltransferase [Profundibacterium mesophilum]KAF0675327.1 putative acetyltransferase [Profundibacterium mesophilum KAUST100406-0324]
MARIHAAAMRGTRPWSAGEFERLLGMPGVFAVGDGHGFALGRVILDEAELLTLAVDPGRRRRGLGRAALGQFHDIARSGRAERAFLEVDAENDAARALYLLEGYAETGRRRGYYTRAGAPPSDAVIMARAL